MGRLSRRSWRWQLTTVCLFISLMETTVRNYRDICSMSRNIWLVIGEIPFVLAQQLTHVLFEQRFTLIWSYGDVCHLTRIFVPCRQYKSQIFGTPLKQSNPFLLMTKLTIGQTINLSVEKIWITKSVKFRSGECFGPRWPLVISEWPVVTLKKFAINCWPRIARVVHRSDQYFVLLLAVNAICPP